MDLYMKCHELNSILKTMEILTVNMLEEVGAYMRNANLRPVNFLERIRERARTKLKNQPKK
jgi:hypothetical protein